MRSARACRAAILSRTAEASASRDGGGRHGRGRCMPGVLYLALMVRSDRVP
jgi:hypothetical protein